MGALPPIPRLGLRAPAPLGKVNGVLEGGLAPSKKAVIPHLRKFPAGISVEPARGRRRGRGLGVELEGRESTRKVILGNPALIGEIRIRTHSGSQGIF